MNHRKASDLLPPIKSQEEVDREIRRVNPVLWVVAGAAVTVAGLLGAVL